MGRTDRFATVPSPIGPLLLTASPAGLSGLYVAGERAAPTPDAAWREDADAFAEVAGQLDAYFAGELTEFHVALDLGGTAFQREVWQALLGVPYGGTTTYGELARAVGRPGAPRAVGAANGRNPVSIVVPCHRVVGADGGLTGYGWGLGRKRFLLDLEAAHARAGTPAGALSWSAWPAG